MPYAVPIVLVTWKMGRRLGFVFAFLCAATYCAADYGSNQYQTHWGYALAVAGWWFYFSVLVVAVTALKARRELDRERIKSLERTQALERQILRTSEREQQRIGRDLHDSLGRNSRPSAMRRPSWRMNCASASNQRQRRRSSSAN